jgi:tetratricopeptide (TPR) repeat protein
LAVQGTGRFERGIEAAQAKVTTDPDILFGYQNLALNYFSLDRFPEAENALQRASERKLESPLLLVIRYDIAVLKGDKNQMDRVVALAKGKHAAERQVAEAEAVALARFGRLQAARRSSSRAIDLALQEGQPETAAGFRAARAVWEAVSGNADEGRKSAMAAVELSKSRDIQYAAGLALALSGDYSRSETLAADLEKRSPEDTFVKFTYVPVLRGLVALRRGNPAESLEGLETARQFELAVNGLNALSFNLGGLDSAYVRGEAFLAEHRHAEAAAEFQKILDHRGLVGLNPIGALVHLQLGRAYAASGDKGKAKAAYETFLALWKDADADVPILKSAKAEYSRLS